jgi:ABC-2 type transport system permease protein
MSRERPREAALAPAAVAAHISPVMTAQIEIHAGSAAAPATAAFSTLAPVQPRTYGGVNWEGLKTLYLKEVRRFWKVGLQTVASPVVTVLLYMMVFVVATRGARPGAAGVPFAQFVAPGLIMMSILNNAFANSSSSLIQAKIMGTAPDFLTPPLSAFELCAGFALGAATRGIVVGVVTAVACWPFSRFGVYDVGAILYFGVVASLLMGLVGVLTGLWAEKFDHLAAVTNFVVMPLTFISGTFYSTTALPEPFRLLTHFNPMFYLIDGFRYGFIGHADGSLWIGAVYSAALTLVLAVWCWGIFRTGWRLKT